MSSSGDFEEFSIYCENGEWLESGQVRSSQLVGKLLTPRFPRTLGTRTGPR